MKGFREKVVAAKFSSKSLVDTSNRALISSSSEPGSGDVKKSEGSLLSGFLTSAFSIFETYSESSAPEKKAGHSKSNGWAASLKRVVTAGSMRRILDRVLGPSRTGIISSTSDIWLLGVCYKISQEESTSDVADSNGLVAFNQDFSSRILITYRKGFDTIGDSKFTSDVGWGCMLRSSQMLIAQALLFHRLGRSWRKSSQKPFDLKYLEILHLFGDAEASPFSIHNLLQAGKAYGLAAGSWVSPYAMCRTWESLARCKRKEISLNCQPLPMAVYVVSGDEEGEQGGAPVVCIEDASKHCFEISKGDADWMPILLLVPLVLGLEKVNPRFIPSLRVTFSFPQSLGIMGGKPGASTYIVGVQEDCAFYLDPHDVQPVVIVNRDDLEVDTSSYHCDVVRHIQLNSIDPSLAIGFYCQDKDDFDDFCSRASKLADESDGAPLFTVTQTHKKPVNHGDVLDETSGVREDDSLGVVPINDSEGNTHEDDWLLL